MATRHVVDFFRVALLWAIASCSLLISPASAQCDWNEEAKVVAGDGGPGDQFGMAVALSGDLMVVGAPYNDQSGKDNEGAAYVFRRNGSTWVFDAKLIAGDGEVSDWFGWSVAIHGGTIVVGVGLSNGYGNKPGKAHVFRQQNGIWVQEAKLTASDGHPYDVFGWSVAMSGDLIAVGAFRDNVGPLHMAGTVYVFRRERTVWTDETKLVASDAEAEDQFGVSVGLSGDRVVVGADQKDAPSRNSGAAYVFRHEGAQWIEEAGLIPGDPGYEYFFGESVSIDRDAIVISANGNQPERGAGSAYVFRCD